MGFLCIPCSRSFGNVDHWCSYSYKYVYKLVLSSTYRSSYFFWVLWWPSLLKENNLMLAGLLTNPLAPPSFWKWINHAGNHHVGALSFLIMDIFLFFGVAVLTLVQASQVRLWDLLYFQYICNAGTLVLFNTIDFSSLLTKETIGFYNNWIHNPKLHLYSAQGVMHFLSHFH